MNKPTPDPVHYLIGLLFLLMAILPAHASENHIAAGFFHNLFVDQNGQVWVWGNNPLEKQTNIRIPYPVMQNGRSVFSNSTTENSFIIKQDGSLWGWGPSYRGEQGIVLSIDSITGRDVTAPRKIMDQVEAVSGSHLIFAIKPDGSLWSWGEERYQPGDAPDANLAKSTKIMDNVTKVAAVYAHTVALQKDGSLWAWGNNQCGALGTGDTEEHFTPVRVNTTPLGNRKVVQMAVRFGETYLVADDGTVWYSGEYNIHQDGCIPPLHLLPTRLDFIDNVERIALGEGHELYLKKDGSLWAFGSGGAALSRYDWTRDGPRKVMDDVKEIAAGFMHSVALKKDGTVWTWGDNSNGLLGDGTSQSSMTPIQVHFSRPETPTEVAMVP